MPLDHSGTKTGFKKNVETLMGEVGQSPHVQSRQQALAIAYSLKRRSRDAGGSVHVGPIRSTVPGRTDKHDMDVPAGSYVLPAECVSNLGQNNTEAGLAKLQEVMRGSPESIRRFFGSTRPPVHHLLRALGGRSDAGTAVPIRAAGGEFVMTPQQVGIVGYDNVEHGHDVLDKWVLSQRKNHIKTLRGLAPPARD